MGLQTFVKTLVDTYKEDRRHQKRSTKNRSEYAAQLYRDGFLVIPDYTSSEQCLAWQNAVMTYLKDNGILELCQQPMEDTLIRKYPSGAELQIRQSHDGYTNYDTGMIDFMEIHHEIDQINAFRNDSFIKKVIEEAHGSEVSVVQTSLYRNLALKAPRSYHMDVYKRTTYKAFIYLTDVPTCDFGPYSFIEKSHGPNLSRYLNLTLNTLKGYPVSDARIHQKDLAHPFLANKGTLIITNQRGYHRGYPQKDGHERVLLVNAYKPV